MRYEPVLESQMGIGTITSPIEVALNLVPRLVGNELLGSLESRSVNSRVDGQHGLYLGLVSP